MEPDSLELGLAKKSYEEIQNELDHLDNPRLHELLDSRSIRIGGTATEILEKAGHARANPMTALPHYDDQSYPRATLPDGFDSYAEQAAEHEGLLEGVRVQTNATDQFSVTFTSTDRVDREMASALEGGVRWFASPSLIVLSKVTAWVVEIAARWAYRERYFNFFFPCSQIHSESSQALVDLTRCTSEADQFDAFNYGYFESVATLNDGTRRPAYFMTPARFRGDIDISAHYGVPMFVEPGLIVVSEIRPSICQDAVTSLAEQGFFSNLKPIS